MVFYLKTVQKKKIAKKLFLPPALASVKLELTSLLLDVEPGA